MIRAIVASARALIRNALKAAVESDGAIVVVGEAGTISELADLCDELTPDVTFVDSSSGVFEGFRVLGHPGMRIVLITDEKALAPPSSRDVHVEIVGANAPMFELIEAIRSAAGRVERKNVNEGGTSGTHG